MADKNDIILGIDLGTTYSLGAYFTSAGPMLIRDETGNGLVPSVIAFSDGRVSVGSDAKKHAVENPLATVYSVKRLMGRGLDDVRQELPFLPYHIVEGNRETVRVEVDGKLLTPQELSAIILNEVRGRAEKALGQKITQAVITVPAYFDDAQRQATRDAGRLAGLDVKRIVNEPTAAALAYGLDRKESATIAVYDLGGGTFDISILRVDKGVFQVLSTHGDTHLGGDDLDRELITLITSEIQAKFGSQLTFGPATRQALRDFAEATKIRLSSQMAANIEVDLGEGRIYKRTITREEFERRAKPWIEKTIDACKQALAAGDIPVEEIEQVVMVGGCTRIPMVQKAVGDFFEREPYTAINPDEVVALGAAVQAGILSGRIAKCSCSM